MLCLGNLVTCPSLVIVIYIIATTTLYPTSPPNTPFHTQGTTKFTVILSDLTQSLLNIKLPVLECLSSSSLPTSYFTDGLTET